MSSKPRSSPRSVGSPRRRRARSSRLPFRSESRSTLRPIAKSHGAALPEPSSRKRRRARHAAAIVSAARSAAAASPTERANDRASGAA